MSLDLVLAANSVVPDTVGSVLPSSTPSAASNAATTSLPSTTLSLDMQYEHYVRHFGSYSYVLIILMGFSVLLGSLLIAYVKKIDTQLIMRHHRHRQRQRRPHRGCECDTECDTEGDCECEQCQSYDISKDFPPEYQIALDMPKPTLSDYIRSNLDMPGIHVPSRIYKPRIKSEASSSEVYALKTGISKSSGYKALDFTAVDIDDLKPKSSTSCHSLPSYEEYVSSTDIQQ